jgi:hypothetical protein
VFDSATIQGKKGTKNVPECWFCQKARVAKEERNSYGEKK